MKLELDQVYSYKLNSGEELVAKLVAIENDDMGSYFKLNNPVSIGPSANGSLGLIPSMFTVNPSSQVRLNTNSVSLVAETDEAVKSKYIEATTGIKVPDKKVILG